MSVEELKELQIAIIHKSKIINLIFMFIYLIGVCCTALVGYSMRGDIHFLLVWIFFVVVLITIVFAIVRGIVLGQGIRRFTTEYKNIFVLGSLKKVFDEVNYDIEKGIDENAILNTQMMNTGDRYHSNDYISGRYKGINFEQSDVHIEKEETRTDSDGHTETYYVTIFKGRLMTFDFNKSFVSNVQVISRLFPYDATTYHFGYSKISLEDSSFNKQFAVYAQDEHDAFYILTPHFMEKISSITKQLDCGVMFCFINKKLHVAINNYEDSFECNVYKVLNEAEIEENIMKDIKIITDFVDELNLDNNLFRKEV